VIPLSLLVLAAVAHAQEPAALTLDQAVALALEHNPGITAAQAGLDEAVADHTVTRARVLPRFSATASASLLDPDRLAPISLSSPSGEPVSMFGREEYAGLVGRQLLFDGSVLPALASARRGVDVADLGVASAEAEIRYSTTVAYVRLLVAEANEEVATDAVGRQIAFEGLVTRLQAADKGTRLDLLKAQAQRMEAELLLVAAKEARGVAEAQLRRALGVGADFPVAARRGEFRVVEPPPTEESLYADVVSTNPALAQQAARWEQSDASVRAAWGEHLPDLSLAASYGYRDRDVGGGADEYTVGVYLDWPLFSGLAIDGLVARSNAKRTAAEAGRVAIEDQLRVDVRGALAGWHTALATVEAAEGIVEVDQEAVEASTAMFEADRATSLDVLTAQSELTRSEAALIRALGDYAIARASVERLLGRPLT
jgi:outer membrane protein TolC